MNSTMGGRILIVSSTIAQSYALKIKLREACYYPILAENEQTALTMAATMFPDLILLDNMLNDVTGIDLLQKLRLITAINHIPVIMLSECGLFDQRITALQAGADDVLTRPIDDTVLLARLRNLLRNKDAFARLFPQDDTLSTLGLAESPQIYHPPGTIAFINHPPAQIAHWRQALSGLISDQLVSLSRAEVLAETDAGLVPDIFVINAGLDDIAHGLQLISELRSRPATQHAGIVLVHPNPTGRDIALAYDMGANEALSINLSHQEFALRLHAMMMRKQASDQLRASIKKGLRLAVIDPLTGLYNRRYALPRLSNIARQSRLDHTNFAVMIVDIDRFKAVNDHYGHASGDIVLIEVAQRLSKSLHHDDLIARLGGEEFLMALPAICAFRAQEIAEKLRTDMEASPIFLANGQKLTITISVGLTLSQSPDSENITELIERADRALLDAKAAGRNCIVANLPAPCA